LNPVKIKYKVSQWIDFFSIFENIIFQGIFMNKSKTSIDKLLAWFGRRKPLSLAFELTHLCNLNCHYCDRHTPLPKELKNDQIFSALNDFIEMGMWKINLDGGEPLIHKSIDEIVQWLVDNNISVRVNTNGILVPKKIDTVRKLDGVKISLDGPKENHDRMRGKGAFEKALNGALMARDAGVPKVEFTCVVGQHNVNVIDEFIDRLEELDFSVIFQPARNSLFINTDRSGSSFQLEGLELRKAFQKIERHKRQKCEVISNSWASLRHFRRFPHDTNLPCSAGWISVTMNPEGNLYRCGMINRLNKSNNVVRTGVRMAYKSLNLHSCPQCWCARTVEGNYRWGARFDKFLPPIRQ
jgi:MoaA/NifB/PqqE/SkfB family radical SAM enzyme